MAISEESRHRIYEAFRVSHGDEVANGLMELLPPVGWADVATRADVAAIEERMDARFDGLEERMELRFQIVDEKFATLRQEFATTRHEFGERLERELRRQSTRFVAFMFTGLAAFGLADRLV